MSEMTTQTCMPLTHESQISGRFIAIGKLAVGKDVNISLLIKNPTTDPKDLLVKIRACSIVYTRKELHELLNGCTNILLNANEEKELPVTISYSQYDGRMTADNMIEVTAVLSCEKTNEMVLVQSSLILQNPPFEMKIQGKAYVNKSVTVEIVFTNPLDTEVTDIEINAEGSGLLTNPVTKRACSVKAKGTITIPVTFMPYKTGKKHLLVDFTCDSFKNIKGYMEIDVQEAENVQ